MFGATSGFGGFGASQNQQQPQQQGQPQQQAGGLFGAATNTQQQPQQAGFGGFGQPAQTPAFGAQPAAQPAGGGLFGGAANTGAVTGGTGFTFGQPAAGTAQQPGAAGGGLFGATQANKSAGTGFGGFGASTTGTSFGGFGATSQPQTNAFGTSTSTFGAPKPAGTGLFGAAPATTPAFGQGAAVATPFGAAAAPGTSVPTTGTASPPYQPHVITEKDGAGVSSQTFSYQTITCMPAYQKASLEELRVQDYAQGRKTGQAGPGAPGATTGGFSFGQQNTGQTNAFGQANAGSTGTGLFGQSQQQAGTGLFGQPQQQQQPGQTGGLFGQQQTGQTGTGLFGQQSSGTGLFGQTQQTQQQQQTGGLFGQPQQHPGGGLFGQSQQQQGAAGTNTFSFGQPSTSTATTGFGFGQQAGATDANKPAGTTLFGGLGGQQQQPPATGGFSFGQPQQQQQQTGGAFGQTGATGGGLFGQQKPAGTGLFGASTTTATSQPAFGGFGASSATNQAGKPAFSFGGTGTTGAFGAASTTASQPGQTGGLFGNAGTQQQQPAAGGLFGGGAFGAGQQPQQPQQQQQQPGTTGGVFGTSTTSGLFGQQPQPQQVGQTGGLFSAKPAGQTTGLFGANTASQQQQQPGQATGTFGSGGLFGGGAGATKPAFGTGGGLFGGGAAGQTGATAGGLFGNTQQGGATGGGLFGAKPAGALGASTGFGGSTLGGGGGGGLFASSGTLGQLQLQQQQQQANVQVSLDQNPYGTDSLFGSQVPTGLAAQQPLPFNVAVKSSAKKPPLMASVFSSPRASVKVTRLRSATPSLGSSLREGTPGAGRASTPGAGARYNSPSLFRGLSDEQTLAPQAFVSKPSVKKLFLDDSVGSNSSFSRGPGVLRTGRARTIAAEDQTRTSITTGASPAARMFSPALETSSASARRAAPVVDDDTSLSQIEMPLSGTSADIFNTTTADTTTDSPLRRRAPVNAIRNASAAPSGSTIKTRPREEEAAAVPKLEMGYYTLPALSEMRTWPFNELAAVKDFIVGRKGFGEIRFLKPVDLTTVPDLVDIPGGIVQLRRKECYVYPEPEDCSGDIDGMRRGFRPPEKMPPGEGLNRPAIISLQGCWALDKSTRAPIKDPAHPRYKQHLAKLKNREDADFVSFEAEQGTWTFRVEHFSRYGLDIDEDEDNAAEKRSGQSMRKKAAAAAAAADTTRARTLRPRPAKQSAPAAEEETSEDEEEEDDDGGIEMEVIEAQQPAFQPFAAALGVEPRKMQVMQASFFGQGPETTPKDLGAVKSTAVSKKQLRDSSLGTGVFSTEHGSSPLRDAVQTRPTFSQRPSAAVEPPARKFTKTILVESVIKGAEKLALDPVLALARSFRPGWGSSGLLVHNAIAQGTSEQPVSLSTLRFSTVKAAPSVSDSAKQMLQLQLQHSDIEFDDVEGVPTASAQLDVRFKDFAQHFAPNEHSHEALLWRLGQSLFDEIDLGLPADAPTELRSAALSLRRKAALSRWLSNAVAASVDSEVRGHTAAGKTASIIFSYLTGNQLERAAMAAIDSRNLHLATLISQLPGDEEMRVDINDQLRAWREEGVDHCISADFRKLYELFSGNVTISPGTISTSLRGSSEPVPDLTIAQTLDWKRTFGLHLWYHIPHEIPLERAVQTYENAVKNVNGTAAPLPPYAESAKQASSRDRDILYHMLRLYSDPLYDLESVLSPRGYSESKADYRLAWQLYLLLSRVLRVRDFTDRVEVDEAEASRVEDEEGTVVDGNSATADLLTSNLAAQLELDGLTEWSAFALLHLELPASRAVALKALLGRNIEHLTTEQECFLVERLLIPPGWVHTARADAAAARNDKYTQYQLLVRAQNFVGAHEIAVRYLAPEAVVHEDHNLILALFAVFPPEIELPGWLYGGQVLVDWVACQRNLPVLLAADMHARSQSHNEGVADGDDTAAVGEKRLKKLTRRVHELIALVPSSLYPDERPSEAEEDWGNVSLEARGRLTRYVAKTEMMSKLQNLARIISVHSEGTEAGADWSGRLEKGDADNGGSGMDIHPPGSASVAPEVDSVQDAARDYCAMLVGC
ncbi:hypothetical protein K437DRAFT_257715 [Tilletiaria anomala UBC 951]|uniref:Peptidase S59 domain-containing protein n=1 Tax=Tilletiaria anomala (strain ATCC 24038 / CBS 436.72 / UBC 951) TaxID=1037660 RepID=A0A066VN53_TILAU|nr:uncharacterized protein K437DRAFT_257715 [Tilletiaria anomala UBC 951]KDN42866.1 hypothetical protein K437DRAFT_257715 [Tilletiaria anomala UBC 951]